MSTSSRFYMEMDAISENEGFARVCIAAFCARLDPTLEEINDIKTAVSEAVTNSIIHGYKKHYSYPAVRTPPAGAAPSDPCRRSSGHLLP